MESLQSYLQDTWVTGQGEGTRLSNPATGAALATASTQGLDLLAALDFARTHGGAALRELTFAQRGEILLQLSKVIHGMRDELIELSQANTGSTRGDAKFDIDGAAATLSAYAALGAELGSRRTQKDGDALQLGRSPRFFGQHVKVPLRGVAIHINAFNFPAWGTAEKLACAFLAGMPVLTKPATSTAWPAFRMAQSFVASGALPRGSWAFLAGGAGDLLDHVGFQDVIAFTGSAKTGHTIRAHPRVVSHSVRVNVEADSLNAVVVGPDVEPGSDTWDLFVRELVREVTQKSGQKCTATRRVFLPSALLEPAIEALKTGLDAVVAGDPSNPAVRMGCLSTPSQIGEVQSALKRLLEVAKVVHGKMPKGTDALMTPLLLVAHDTGAQSPVHMVEAFGPVATLMAYDGEAAQAAQLVAFGGGGLVASVYSDDLAFVEAIVSDLLPYHGRILLGSKRIAEHSTGPGLVLPGLTHGGPGRAGGGLELGGIRGLDLYLQTCAVQGALPVLERILSE